MRSFLTIVLFLLTAGILRAQSLTVGQCYELARQNYPLVRQAQLLDQTEQFTVQNVSKGFLPQLTVSGQATYQSQVTEVPIRMPGFNITPPSKDQYKVFTELSQVIYDGGNISAQKQLQRSNVAIEKQKLDAELYQLKGRVNQLFFGILLINEQIAQNDLLIKDLETGLKKVEASITNGVAFRSNSDVVRAEILRNLQRNTELIAIGESYRNMLSVFIGKELDQTTRFSRPQLPPLVDQINRPELLVYDKQKAGLDIQDKLLRARLMPKIGFFVQGGLGRPALNMLSNNFEGYYFGGLRLSWSPSSLYTLKNDRAMIDISGKTIDIQRETFLFNTKLNIRQQNAETSKYKSLLLSDDEIINLRQKVKTASLAQLENGVINASDYLREVNAEDMAKQGRILHEIQLLMSQFNQQATSGNL